MIASAGRLSRRLTSRRRRRGAGEVVLDLFVHDAPTGTGFVLEGQPVDFDKNPRGRDASGTPLPLSVAVLVTNTWTRARLASIAAFGLRDADATTAERHGCKPAGGIAQYVDELVVVLESTGRIGTYTISAGTTYTRITEDGQTRVTEAGVERVTELAA